MSNHWLRNDNGGGGGGDSDDGDDYGDDNDDCRAGDDVASNLVAIVCGYLGESRNQWLRNDNGGGGGGDSDDGDYGDCNDDCGAGDDDYDDDDDDEGRKEMFYLTTHSTHFITVIWRQTYGKGQH